jgi:hypothetical protein
LIKQARVRYYCILYSTYCIQVDIRFFERPLCGQSGRIAEARAESHLQITANRIGRSLVGIYKALTDTLMGKLVLWPRNSFSANICFEFSVLVLCSLFYQNNATKREFLKQREPTLNLFERKTLSHVFTHKLEPFQATIFLCFGNVLCN